MSDENVVLKRAELEAAILKTTEKFEEAIERAHGQAKDAGSVSVEAKNEAHKLGEKLVEVTDRLIAVEQRGVGEVEHKTETVGDKFVKSDAWRDMVEGRQSRARVEFKTAIVNTYPESSVQPLVQGDRITSNVFITPNRRLTLRDILPVSPTTSNLVEFTRENTFTNNAGPQRDTASPLAAVENQTLPESADTFTLATTPVVTLGHWIPISQQVFSDSPMLSAHIQMRLMYGLKLKEETQLLAGLGTGRELTGLQTAATSYTVESPQLTNEIDILRDCITQAQVAEYSPNFLVLNPADWDSIQRRKVGSSDDRYVYGDPNMSWMATPIWGLTPIVTNSQTAGTFLMGDTNACMIYDRQQASVEASMEDSTNFQKLMVSLRATERLALAIFRTEAFLTGSL